MPKNTVKSGFVRHFPWYAILAMNAIVRPHKTVHRVTGGGTHMTCTLPHHHLVDLNHFNVLKKTVLEFCNCLYVHRK